MQLSFESRSVEETVDFGQRIGRHLEAGTVIGLDGTLGAGKTHLVQGIAMGLGLPAGSVISPTYTICIPYEARLPLLHLDAYRIRSPEEVDELGLDEAVDRGVVLIVEWASRIENVLPDIDLSINICQTSETARELIVRAAQVTGPASLPTCGTRLIAALRPKT